MMTEYEGVVPMERIELSVQLQLKSHHGRFAVVLIERSSEPELCQPITWQHLIKTI